MEDFKDYSDSEMRDKARELGQKIERVEEELQKGLVGQEDVIHKTWLCVIADGNILLEGVPGLGKSLLIEILGKIVGDSEFTRIQFQPDLLPADIIGIEAYDQEKGFYTEKGPIFANFVLADEINRAPPKVQSAMLEAMQENKVTIGEEDYDLPQPFFTMATQNPLEQGGTYPLPEAQIDRFLFKIVMDYPKKENEKIIIDKNANRMDMEEFHLEEVIQREELIEMQNFSKQVRISDEIKRYIIDLVNATRNPSKYELDYDQYIDYGASPRASINLALAARAKAVSDGRHFVKPKDVRDIIMEVFEHRVILNYEGEAEGIETEEIVQNIIDRVPVR